MRAARCPLLLIAIGAVLAGGTQRPAVAGADDPVFLPDGAALMRKVLDALPDARLTAQTELQAKSRKGRIEKILRADMTLNWKGEQPSAHYTLRDAFGATLEALTVIRPPEGEAEYLYFIGDPLTGRPTPDLFAPIQGTDINWIDLGLDFLWWPNGTTVGTDTIKGRLCYMVEVPGPSPGDSRYGQVRLWIDPQVYVLLQAVACDVAGREIKRLQVRSFKKIRGLWTISDLEVQTLESRHKTLLKVRNMELQKEPDPGESDSDEQESIDSLF